MFLDWIQRLGDRADFELFIKCEKCGHNRHVKSRAMARIAGADCLLTDLAKRLRCSKCGAHEPLLRTLSGHVARRD